MHNICTISIDLRPQLPQIESDFVNTYYAMYMKALWGVEVGYAIIPWPVASMRWEICMWQITNDCGRLCTESLAEQ